MQKDRVILYVVLAFLAGCVVMGIVDARANKPLFSSADSGSKGKGMMVGSIPTPMPTASYDLNNDGVLNEADIQIERTCIANIGTNCSLERNDFNSDGVINVSDLRIISLAVYSDMYDLNDDGSVNDADLQIQRACQTNLGTNCSVSRNDFNRNGVIDAGDIMVMRNFIRSYGSSK